MSLIKYVPKTTTEYGTVVLTKSLLTFNSTFHKEFLHNCQKVNVYYDQDKREIGLEESKNGGLRVIHKKESRQVNLSGFYKHFKLIFTSRLLKKTEKRDDMVIVKI